MATNTNNPNKPSLGDQTLAATANVVRAGGNELQQGANYLQGKLQGKGVFSEDTKMTLEDYDNEHSVPKYFDVAGKYAWTLTPSDNRLDVPYIILEEYEQNLSTLYAQLVYWSQNLTLDKKSNASPYEGLYHAKKTFTTFVLPYFNEYDRNTQQNWEKTKGIGDFDVVDKLLNIVGNVGKTLNMAPGTTVNQPKEWTGSGANSYNVSFKLFNTINKEETLKNIEFKRRISVSTLHDQRGPILSSPPALFTVEIPGVRYSPAAVISQLSITNVGQMNILALDAGNDIVVPDAYDINIQILELITESRQILNSTQTRSFNPVRAIIDTGKNVQPINEITNNLANLISSPK